jgi:hypothetical protein
MASEKPAATIFVNFFFRDCAFDAIRHLSDTMQQFIALAPQMASFQNFAERRRRRSACQRGLVDTTYTKEPREMNRLGDEK